MKFDPMLILPEFDPLAEGAALVVALSGGLDSMVLLQALHQLGRDGSLPHSLSALHINHGLSPRADDWQMFCQSRCAQLGVPLECFRADIRKQPGDSLEELARQARYAFFEQSLQPGQCLVMGHHLDDQMETLLLRLTRGAAPGGLAGIPRSRSLGKGSLLRPLLSYPRRQLLQFARHNAIDWVEDESNSSLEFDRNYWRAEILPLIEQRFPGFRAGWKKSMTLCAEADQLCEELASEDLSIAVGDDPRILNVAPLLHLGEFRRRNLLRYWMLKAGFSPPDWQLLRRLSGEILVSERYGATLSCSGGEVRKFADQLVLLRDSGGELHGQSGWRPGPGNSLDLQGNGRLVAVPDRRDEVPGGDQRLALPAGPLSVRYGAGGEQVRLAKRPLKTVRKILQETTLAPWLRSRQPLVYCEGRLICIPGVGVAEGYLADAGEPAVTLLWEPPDLLFDSARDGLELN